MQKKQISELQPKTRNLSLLPSNLEEEGWKSEEHEDTPPSGNLKAHCIVRGSKHDDLQQYGAQRSG
jgi:hypothetical protein